MHVVQESGWILDCGGGNDQRGGNRGDSGGGSGPWSCCRWWRGWEPPDWSKRDLLCLLVSAAALCLLPGPVRAAALGLLAGDDTRAVITGRSARAYMEAYRAECRRRGYQFFDEPWQLNLIGVRNPTEEAGEFDDQFSVLFYKGNNEWEVVTYTATTDPGRAWLKVNFTAKGTAILCPGQYVDSWEIGYHKGNYEALVQRLPVRIWRDSNRDGKIDAGLYGTYDEEGVFGINIHHGGIRDAKQYDQLKTVFSDMVEKYSSGCQVLATEADFKHFMGLVKKSRDTGYGKNFTYTLFQGEDMWEKFSKPLQRAIKDNSADARGNFF